MLESPDHWGGYKWAAIQQGTLGDMLPLKEKIAQSFEIKENLLEAEKRAPNV